MVSSALQRDVLPLRDPHLRLEDSAAIFRCLRDSKLFRDYREAFEVTTGFPLVLRAAGSFKVPLQGSKRTNPFCALMAGANKSCSACLQLQHRVETEAVLESNTLQCYAGMSESVVPVRVGNHVLGYLQTGQVFLSRPTAERFQTLQRLSIEAGGSGAPADLKAAYFQTRVIPAVQYHAIIQMLVIFAKHLAAVSNQLMTSQSLCESPLITKVRGFISEHQDEPLSLDAAARAVNMNPFYFCKIFKRATGLTFTAYLARARIEAVKLNLQNVHVRISEAAFAAGFQSLSQFNRVFLRVAGESPTDYRARQPGLGAPAGRGRRAARGPKIAVG